MNPLFTEPEFINQALVNVFHFMFVVAAALYVIFALLVVRQIDLMKKTLITKISPFITALGIAHLGTAVMLLWFFAVWL